MREPVVAASGSVRVELPANRATFGIRFSAVEHTAATASADAAKKAHDLDQSLSALGTERVRLRTVFETKPLYDQYRQKDGTLVENSRADKIDRYEVTANLSVTVRDTAVLERAYRLAVAAKPSGIDSVVFSLEPDNATKTWLATEAVKDAARRAREAVAAGGGRLGPPKIIDPSGSVCQTEVLAGWPSYVGGAMPTDVQRPDNLRALAPPPPPMAAPAPPAGAPTLDQEAQTIQVTLQPPLTMLTDTACVIYALLP